MYSLNDFVTTQKLYLLWSAVSQSKIMEISVVTILIRDGNLVEADWCKRSIILAHYKQQVTLAQVNKRLNVWWECPRKGLYCSLSRHLFTSRHLYIYRKKTFVHKRSGNEITIESTTKKSGTCHQTCSFTKSQKRHWRGKKRYDFTMPVLCLQELRPWLGDYHNLNSSLCLVD